MKSPLGVNLEIPIYAKYMKSEVIIGYISIDYIKNGL